MQNDTITLPGAILFDMDGTLTEPMLDFPRIKAEMGIGDRPILEALAALSGPARAAAEAVLLRHEEHAAEHSTLNPGCRELLDWLHEQRIATALITRNSRLSMQTVLRRHNLSLDVLVTREDPPYKPDPHPLKLACEKLAIPPAGAWMVGDGWYDIQAGLASQIKTIWLSHGKPRPFTHQPWRELRDLVELHNLLRDPAGGGASGSGRDRSLSRITLR
jgi:HAD superfamily hydrolase (TIGR01509 family)